MTDQQFKYDVFLTHIAKDKEVVREIAERLKSEWTLLGRPGRLSVDSRPAFRAVAFAHVSPP